MPYNELAGKLIGNRIKMIALAITLIVLFILIFRFVIWRLIQQLEAANTALDLKVSARTSDLEESERRFRSTFEQAPVGICHTAPDGTFLRLNHRFCEIVGYSGEELRSLTFQDITPLDDLQVYMPDRDAVLAGAKDCFTVEKRYVRKDQSISWVHLTVSLIKNESGDPDYLIGIVEDITERRRLKQQLQQSQKMEAIGTLAGGIAHDFNNILGAIIGYTEMAIEANSANITVAHHLDKVLEAGGRAAELVKQILSFSRQANTEKNIVDPMILVKEAVKLLRPILPSTITIRQRFDAVIHPIFVNPTQIHQVMMNLCTNAYHAMEQAGGVLEVSLRNQELSSDEVRGYLGILPGSFVVLSITDTGMGMAPETREKMFEPYFTTKEADRGTGLGLSIVHGIVADAGGFITCASTLGHGTTFEVFFPAAQEPTETASPQAVLCCNGNERILWIDDEAILADIGRRILEPIGYTIEICTNGREALDLFARDPNAFDAIITDQTMPGLTGLDLAQQILRLRSDIPIILCTGYSSLVDEEHARKYGIKGFAMKPLNKQTIVELLRRVLDGARSPCVSDATDVEDNESEKRLSSQHGKIWQEQTK